MRFSSFQALARSLILAHDRKAFALAQEAASPLPKLEEDAATLIACAVSPASDGDKCAERSLHPRPFG